MVNHKKVPSNRPLILHLPGVGKNNRRRVSVAAVWFARFGLMGCLGFLLTIPGCIAEQVLASTECGNGRLDPDAGEQCDDGNHENHDGCDRQCQIEPGFEICDNSIDDDSDGLSDCDDPDCSEHHYCNPVCGDGDRGDGEECDDGNTADGDGCSSTCQNEVVCGNGVVEAGEECDDGEQTGTCDADCTTAQCGDGVINPEAGEACDDGNTIDGDGCSSTCLLEDCGNGRVDIGEECDAGGESAACDGDCTLAMCGDGWLNAAAGEQCDDGNNVNDDGCSSTCMLEAICGDGVCQPIEDCGNCPADCGQCN